MALLLLVMAAPGMAQDTITGTIQLDNETVTLAHVYARRSVPSPTSGGDGHVIILMTDRPAPPDVRASRQSYYAAAREGRIRGAMLVLEPGARFVLFAPGGSYADTRVPDIFERITLAGLQQDNSRVAGHLAMSEADMLNSGDEGSPASYRVDARFSAAVAPAPQPRETLTGAAARNSPQAAAALQALRIIRTGTAADVRTALHPDHPVWEMLDAGQADAILEMARQMLPAPDTFLQSVQRLVVYDDRAVIIARDNEGDTTVSLRRDGDDWKLARAPIPND